MKKLLAIGFSLCLMSAPLMAQDVDPGVAAVDEPLYPAPSGGQMADDPAGTDNANPGGIPVDGGLSLLLAAGAAYGARRLKGGRSQ
jgi:hypothetical protein